MNLRILDASGLLSSDVAVVRIIGNQLIERLVFNPKAKLVDATSHARAQLAARIIRARALRLPAL